MNPSVPSNGDESQGDEYIVVSFYHRLTLGPLYGEMKRHATAVLCSSHLSNASEI